MQSGSGCRNWRTLGGIKGQRGVQLIRGAEAMSETEMRTGKGGTRLTGGSHIATTAAIGWATGEAGRGKGWAERGGVGLAWERGMVWKDLAHRNFPKKK